MYLEESSNRNSTVPQDRFTASFPECHAFGGVYLPLTGEGALKKVPRERK
jgi:hypothetical protein